MTTPDQAEACANPRGRWRVMRWQEIAELAEEAGRQAHGQRRGDWRESDTPDRPLSQHILKESLWRLEEKERFAVTDALDDRIAGFFEHADHAQTVVRQMLVRASEQMAPYSAEKPDRYEDWIGFKRPRWLWGAAGDVLLSLTAQPTDEWARAPKRVPAFGSGLAISRKLVPRLADKAEWIAKVEDKGFGFRPIDKDELWVMRTLSLRDLSASRKTFSGQATALGRWTRECFDLMHGIGGWGRLPPDPRRPPAKKRAQRTRWRR